MIVKVPRVATVTREGGRSTHRGRVRQHKKSELPNIGTTQEVPSSLGGYSREREDLGPGRGEANTRAVSRVGKKDRKSLCVVKIT